MTRGAERPSSISARTDRCEAFRPLVSRRCPGIRQVPPLSLGSTPGARIVAHWSLRPSRGIRLWVQALCNVADAPASALEMTRVMVSECRAAGRLAGRVRPHDIVHGCPASFPFRWQPECLLAYGDAGHPCTILMAVSSAPFTTISCTDAPSGTCESPVSPHRVRDQVRSVLTGTGNAYSFHSTFEQPGRAPPLETGHDTVRPGDCRCCFNPGKG